MIGATGFHIVSPGIDKTILAATGLLPLRFIGKRIAASRFFAQPLAVCQRLIPGHTSYRMGLKSWWNSLTIPSHDRRHRKLLLTNKLLVLRVGHRVDSN